LTSVSAELRMQSEVADGSCGVRVSGAGFAVAWHAPIFSEARTFSLEI